MRVDTGEKYTVKQATQHAFLWCQNNPGWKRICDIENSDSLYFTWDELPKKIRKQWKKHFGSYAKEAWEEFGEKPCKVPYGFITGKGEFYNDVLKVPLNHNLMMVFKVN